MELGDIPGVCVGRVKVKGADFGLSVPSLKDAAKVKLAVSVDKDTVQSSDVADGLDV